jgi:predicted transcriptional regulator
MSSIDLTPDNSRFIEVSDAIQLGIQQADQGDFVAVEEVFTRIEQRAAQIAR